MMCSKIKIRLGDTQPYEHIKTCSVTHNTCSMMCEMLKIYRILENSSTTTTDVKSIVFMSIFRILTYV